MINDTYKLKYYLNINRIVEVNRKGKIEKESSPITYEIVLVVHSKIGGHITFSYLESVLDNTLEPYQLTQINEVPPFDTIEPNSRNLAKFVKEKVENILNEQDCEILSIEIGETPLSFYIYDNKTQEEYRRMKTYLNIWHSVEQNGVLGPKHEHSLELHCVVIGFENIEDYISKQIEFYQGKYLNELHDFYKINPTLENISTFLKKELAIKLRERRKHLFSIEIAEKSTISYIC